MGFKGTKEEWEYSKSNTGSFIVLEINKYIGSFAKECNAKKAAAAPELLKALKELLNINSLDNHALFKAQINAQKAINKALN